LRYTTVLSILRTLETKGYVRHQEKAAVHRYAAKFSSRRRARAH